jgi:hypothetical protein
VYFADNFYVKGYYILECTVTSYKYSCRYAYLSQRCDGRSFLKGAQHGSAFQITAKKLLLIIHQVAKVSIGCGGSGRLVVKVG